MWKTNFDRVKQHLRTKKPLDLPPPHTHDYPTQHLNAMSMPKNTVTTPPNVVNVGPRLFHKSEPLSGGVRGQATPPSASPGLPVSNTAPLEPISMPPQLANTLEHIVGQLDVLTQVHVGWVMWVRVCG